MSPKRQVTVNITNRTIVRTIVWVLMAVIAYKFVGRITHVLTLIFISIFLALALNPVVSWMSRRVGIKSRVRATAAAYLTVVAVVVAALLLIIPPLVGQTRVFISDIPQTISSFQEQDNSIARAAKRYQIDEKISQGAKEFSSHYSDFGSAVLNTGKRIIGAVVSVLVVLIMTFMILIEGPYWLSLIWRRMPAARQHQYHQTAHRIYEAVTAFVNGQVIVAVVAGIFAFMALEIFSHIVDVPINALALAGIVTFLGIIPLFGNPTAATIVILVCLLNSVALAIIMLIYFLVYFFVENHTFQPYIQSRLSRLTPLSVFIAALIGVGFAGFLGAIIAIPVASAIKIILEEYYPIKGSS